jgi:hypothetical protein
VLTASKRAVQKEHTIIQVKNENLKRTSIILDVTFIKMAIDDTVASQTELTRLLCQPHVFVFLMIFKII